jgi:hypothetical protein
MSACLELALELIETFLARTAALASAAVVIAVPSDIAATAKTPAEKIPWAKAKTKTIIAPEQGRNPAAIIVKRELFHENPAPSARGSDSGPAQCALGLCKLTAGTESVNGYRRKGLEGELLALNSPSARRISLSLLHHAI